MSGSQNIRVTAQSLAGVEAFSALPEATRESIAQRLHGRRYEAKKTVIRANERDNHVYFVLSGSVKITRYAGRGRQVSFREMHAGEMFGELAALDNGPRSVEVVTECPALVASISDTGFRALLNDHPPVADYVLGRLVHLVRRLTERVVEQATLGVINRIHAELLRRARATGQTGNCITIDGMPTHNAIADRISTHREAVSHEFTRLKKAGIIRREKRKTLVIVDVARLEHMVQHATREIPTQQTSAPPRSAVLIPSDRKPVVPFRVAPTGC